MYYHEMFKTTEPIDGIEVINDLRVAVDWVDKTINAPGNLTINKEEVKSVTTTENYNKYTAEKAKLQNTSLITKTVEVDSADHISYYIPKGAIVKLRKVNDCVIVTWKEIEVSINDMFMEDFFSNTFIK